ncbi:hypothetical protein [Streptomyces sp. TP-A0356]|uniref:hypothetical protein n=1 Tax=Streptomyces sp. TP-A0356 TaxID=1359208 RepID=UPI0006E31400|nr:hypothetical protein [Streptomyces sp. TP-A0356]
MVKPSEPGASGRTALDHDNEYSNTAADRHVQIVAAMVRDGLHLRRRTGSRGEGSPGSLGQDPGGAARLGPPRPDNKTPGR